MMWPLSFKSSCQRYNSLDMDEDGSMPEKHFLAWSSKFAQQITTPRVAPSLSYKPSCKERRKCYLNWTHGQGTEYILETHHSTQGH